MADAPKFSFIAMAMTLAVTVFVSGCSKPLRVLGEWTPVAEDGELDLTERVVIEPKKFTRFSTYEDDFGKQHTCEMSVPIYLNSKQIEFLDSRPRVDPCPGSLQRGVIPYELLGDVLELKNGEEEIPLRFERMKAGK